MVSTDKVFAGSIPALYDSVLVPLIFASYAEDLASRAAASSPSAVLETAAGSGALTRALAPKLGASACYVVSDLNQPMLDLAKSRQADDQRLVWRQVDALSLPFDAGAFDVVACQFGVMFFPDRVRAFSEARRVLKPGGRFVFNAWDRIAENVFADDVTSELARLFPDDPPAFLARTPHGYHDPDAIRRDLTSAGFTNVSIEHRADESRAASPQIPAVAYCQGTPLRSEIEARVKDGMGLDGVTDRVAAALAAKHGTGVVSAKIQALVVSAS